MTVDVWAHVSALAERIEQRFKDTGEVVHAPTDEYAWHNSLYSSNRYRRAHVEVVDHRESHKTYILHCTIFPHFNDASPIWGFDAVCGASKITGAFHDFSSAGDGSHFMMQWFAKKTADYAWNKPRELPVWARSIFSPAMVAAGNVRMEDEVTALCDLALESLDYYLEHVGLTQESGADFHQAQNRYCHYQKQNPHVVRSMVSMGVPEQQITKFVQNILFPESL